MNKNLMVALILSLAMASGSAIATTESPVKSIKELEDRVVATKNASVVGLEDTVVKENPKPTCSLDGKCPKHEKQEVKSGGPKEAKHACSMHGEHHGAGAVDHSEMEHGKHHKSEKGIHTHSH